jgi:hypothetical protein
MALSNVPFSDQSLQAIDGTAHVLVVWPRVRILFVRLYNRKAEPFESEEKRKESHTDGPKHEGYRHDLP